MIMIIIILILIIIITISTVTTTIFSLQPPSTPEREMMNRVLSRVLDLAYEMYREMGASQDDLQDLKHKRGVIQACYFNAVSCY
jgi:uncharacterized protein YpmB